MIKIESGSWHAWLAFTFSSRVRPDICSYIRGVFWGMFVLTLMAVLAAVLVGLPLNALVAVITDYCLFGSAALAGAGILVFVVEVLVGVIFGLIGLAMLYKRRARRRFYDKYPDGIVPNSFVKEAYLSWKGKYCAKIELV